VRVGVPVDPHQAGLGLAVLVVAESDVHWVNSPDRSSSRTG
jgi:hypothetical protein